MMVKWWNFKIKRVQNWSQRMDAPLNVWPLGQTAYSPLHNSDRYLSNEPIFVKFRVVDPEIWKLQDHKKWAKSRNWSKRMDAHINVWPLGQTAYSPLHNSDRYLSNEPLFVKIGVVDPEILKLQVHQKKVAIPIYIYIYICNSTKMVHSVMKLYNCF